MDKVVSEERAPRSLEERRRRLVVVEKKGRKARGMYRSTKEETTLETDADEISANNARLRRRPFGPRRPLAAPAPPSIRPLALNFTAAAGHARPLSLPTIDRR